MGSARQGGQASWMAKWFPTRISGGERQSIGDCQKNFRWTVRTSRVLTTLTLSWTFLATSRHPKRFKRNNQKQHTDTQHAKLTQRTATNEDMVSIKCSQRGHKLWQTSLISTSWTQSIRSYCPQFFPQRVRDIFDMVIGRFVSVRTQDVPVE